MQDERQHRPSLGASTRLAPIRAGQGFWSWLLQRLSGLFLGFFVTVHLVALHFLRESDIDVASVVERLQDSSSMVAFYALFVIVIAFHAFNGIWGIALDSAPSPRGRRLLKYTLWAAGFLVLAYGLLVLRALLALG